MICSSGEDTLDLRAPPPKGTRPLAVKDWSMVIALRHYKKGDGCLPYLGSHVLGNHGVIHCDILLKRPCTEVWCGKCDRAPDSDPCPDCKPCMYRYMSRVKDEKKLSPEEVRKAHNRLHSDRRKSHIVTYSAREDGVVCQVDRLFVYNSFYRVHVDDQRAYHVDCFFRNQMNQDYNCAGYLLNFLCCWRYCCCAYGTRWLDVGDDDDDNTPKAISKRKWFCSEIVSTALAVARADGFTPETKRPQREPCGLTPDDIADIVLRNPQCYYSISRSDVMLALQELSDYEGDGDNDNDDDDPL